MIGDCLLYGRIVIAFTVSFMLQNLFQNFLITAEKPKLGLFATLGAGITNMVLDALFVGLLGWGVAGAAFATGISQCVGTVIPLVFFFKGKNSPLKFVKTKLEIKPILRACANGSSELMTNISSSIVSMVYNFQLIRYIGGNGISAYGVIMYVQFIFISLFIGYVIGVAPIIGFNYGAKNTAELKNIFKKSVILMGGAGVVLSILAFSLANPLAHIFVGYDAELKALTVKAFRLFAPAFLLAGLNIFASSLFTALNNGLISAIISFLRTLVFQLASVLVLPLIFDYDGIWYSITIAEIFAIIISVAFVLAKRKKYGYF
jgi:Na+-driven multidrug efflux pump